jgi:hypothetical protein
MHTFARLAVAASLLPCSAAFAGNSDFPQTGANSFASPSGSNNGGGQNNGNQNSGGQNNGGQNSGGQNSGGQNGGGQNSGGQNSGGQNNGGPNGQGDGNQSGGGQGSGMRGRHGSWGGGRRDDSNQQTQDDSRDNNPDPPVELSLDDIRSNFDTVIQSYVNKKSVDGVWDYRDKAGRVWRLAADTIESSGVHKTARDVYAGKGTLSDARTHRRLVFEFVVDFSRAWKVVSVKPVGSKPEKKVLGAL